MLLPLSIAALDMMRHCLYGSVEREHRNHYCAVAGERSDAIWSALADVGLAERGRHPGADCVTYRLTDAGVRAIRSIVLRELPPEWIVTHRDLAAHPYRVRAATRGKARMSVALCLDEAWNCGVGPVLSALTVRRAA